MKTKLVITPHDKATEIVFIDGDKETSFEELDDATRRMFLHRLPEITEYLKRVHSKLIT